MTWVDVKRVYDLVAEGDVQSSQIPKIDWQGYSEVVCTMEHKNNSQNRPGSPDVKHYIIQEKPSAARCTVPQVLHTVHYPSSEAVKNCRRLWAVQA